MDAMILGFVIDEHGNLITGQQADQIMADVQKSAEDISAIWAQLAQACQQAAEAITAFAQAVVQAFNEIFGPVAARWPLLIDEPDLEYLELAYQRFARWYNARHRGRRVSWRRLNADQRWEAEMRFA